MAKSKYLLSLIITAVVLFMSVFPSFYISAEIDHLCIDDDCAVCCQINLCERIQKTSANIVSASSTASLSFFALILCILLKDKVIRHITPVTLKVKLLN